MGGVTSRSRGRPPKHDAQTVVDAYVRLRSPAAVAVELDIPRRSVETILRRAGATRTREQYKREVAADVRERVAEMSPQDRQRHAAAAASRERYRERVRSGLAEARPAERGDGPPVSPQVGPPLPGMRSRNPFA